VFCLTKGVQGDHQTSMGLAFSVEKLVSVLLSDSFMQDDSAQFHRVKEFALFFPVRHKLPNFKLHVLGFLSGPEFQSLCDYSTRVPTKAKPHKDLTPAGCAVLKEYTSGKHWSCTRVNLSLALDVLQGTWANYAKKLKAVIGWQTPKWSGITVRGALHSPLEIFVMCLKKIFYLPSFTSTSRRQDTPFWNPYKEGAKPDKNWQNVIFEIDSRVYPNFTTIIQTNQSEYDESESLLSCYNIYRWVGYKIRPTDGAMVIRLLIEDYQLYQDGEKIRGAIPAISEEWMGERGVLYQERCQPPKMLAGNFTKLVDSYQRHNPEISWLNSEYESAENVPGEELDNFALEALLVKQAERRAELGEQ